MNIKIGLILVILMSSLCGGGTYSNELLSVELFHIKRNKNRNVVQYSVYVDRITCIPKRDNPMHVYWKLLEEGPNVLENLRFYEHPAYGIRSQDLAGSELTVRLNALEEKNIVIKFTKERGECRAVPFTLINIEIRELSEIYVFAKERFLLFPDVKWIEIRGMLDSEQDIVEKISVN